MNLSLSLLQATESAALVAARWIGKGEENYAERFAAQALHDEMRFAPLQGSIVIGESPDIPELASGVSLGSGQGPQVDIVVDVIEGVRLLSEGLPDSLSVLGLAPHMSIRRLEPSRYLQKLVVSAAAAVHLDPQVLDAPPGVALAKVARALDKHVDDLTVFILQRPRHAALIASVREAGARVLLRSEGDIVGALLAATPESGVDLLMGTGATPDSLIAACAVKALGGVLFARLNPQSEPERIALQQAGLDSRDLLTADDLIHSNDVLFAATGITGGLLLEGVRHQRQRAITHSLILHGQSGLRREIRTEHPFAIER